MVEKQCILTEHKEGSGGLAAPADSLTLACHKGESGIGGVSSVGLPATQWEEMALPAQQWHDFDLSTRLSCMTLTCPQDCHA